MIGLFLCLISLLALNIYNYAFYKLNKIKYKLTIKEEILFIIITLINMYITYKELYSIKFIYNLISVYIPLLILGIKHKISIKEQLHSYIIVYFLAMVLDIVSASITGPILTNISQPLRIIVNDICITTIIYLIFYIKVTNKFIIRIKYTLDNNKVINAITLITLLIFYKFGIHIFYNEVNTEIKIDFIVLISVIIILYIYITVNYYIVKTIKDYNKNLLDNIKGNDQLYKDLRIEKHNISNYLLSLKELPKKEIDESINKHLKQNNKKNNDTNIKDIPLSISGFIANKFYNYKHLYVFVDDTIKNINFYDKKIYNNLCNTLGIAIDNSLAAVKVSEDKNIYLSFVKEKEYIKISIVNNFNNSINIDKLGTFLYTTKDDGNGLGIYSIKNNKSLHYNINIINDKFHFNIFIKNKASS